MNRRFMMLMSAVVVGGLAIGAFAASVTTPSGPSVQQVAFAQGQGGGSRPGSNGSNQGSANGQSAGQTPGRGAAPLSGSVTSRDGNTLTVNTQQGDKKVNIAGAKFQKTVDGTTADLKAGETVIVTGQQGSDGVFAASTIQIRPESPAGGQGATGGYSGQGRGQPQGQGQAPAQGQGQGQNSGQGARPVMGSISSVDGDTATITTRQGDEKVKVAGAKIEKTVDATADDLKTGENVVVMGQQGSDGSYTASTVQIVSGNSSQAAKPTPQPQPTPQPTTPAKGS